MYLFQKVLFSLKFPVVSWVLRNLRILLESSKIREQKNLKWMGVGTLNFGVIQMAREEVQNT